MSDAANHHLRPLLRSRSGVARGSTTLCSFQPLGCYELQQIQGQSSFRMLQSTYPAFFLDLSLANVDGSCYSSLL